MRRVHLITREGAEHMLEADDGVTLMEAIRDAGIDELLALCGGCCSCATCHVYVDDDAGGALPPMGDDENDLLDASDHRTAASRLSCQLPVAALADGTRITIAPDD
ncbi:2Fe-2S iron-sulfur cluster-binding protein [Sphingomonas hankookensis]|uniref:Ferredoxin n=1 Tax=Sphingomonas hengshuiensis TaxID=1609977 RepID=A0A2W4ZDB1_9SPHN|nr:MAG: ferredoxin [Sphingomonas hengshuiensis]